MAAILELRAIADGSDDSGCGLRSNALDLGDALADLALSEDAVDLLVEGGDPAVEVLEQIVKLADGLSREIRELVVEAGEDLRDHAARAGDALAKGQAAIEQEPTYLADDGGAVVHKALSRAVQRLDVLLLDRFLWNEAHMGLAGGGADRLGIVAIVLLPTHEGLHVLWTDDPYPVPKLLELPLPVGCSRQTVPARSSRCSTRVAIQATSSGA